LLFFIHTGYAQSLHIDSTRFITGNKPAVILNSAIPTSDGGIFFVGWDGNNPGGIIPYFPDTSGRANVLVGKMDNSKQISWIKIFGGNDEDFGITACQTPDGGYAVLSQVSSSNIDVTDFKGGVDLWLIRLDGTGNLLWKKSYGSSQSEQAISIANTPDGGFILLGNSNGADGDVPFHYGGFFDLDWLVIKIDGSGNVEWSKDLGTVGDETTNGSIIAIDSVYYLVGSSEGKGNDCTDTAWHSGVYTKYDYYILKIDAVGNVMWNRSYGGSESDVTMNAFYDTRDTTIVINGTSASTDYMVSGGHGQEDMWVLKVDLAGTMLWQKTFGTVNSDVGSGLSPYKSDRYLIYGSTRYAIGGGDLWLFMTDIDGNEITNKIFGGVATEKPQSLIAYQNSFAATGVSSSDVFTEGVTYGKTATGQNAFISFIEYWPAAVWDIEESKNPITLVPNPANALVTIRVSNHRNGYLKVYNSWGQVVFEKRNSNGDSVELNTTLWSVGAYLVQWQNDDGTIYHSKLLKN
jgi:hypothetical protein